MTAGEFQTVYDLGQVGYTAWRFAAVGLLLTVVGFVMVFFPRLLSSMTLGSIDLGKRRVFAWIYFLFSAVWTAIAFATTYGTYAYLADRLRSGNYRIAEGPIENFDPMPAGGHKNESFDVAGQHFEYSDYNVSGGFNNAASHGGPIRPGLYVRISHVDGRIIRIEVRQSPSPNT